MESPERIICFSDEMKIMLDEFTKFMFQTSTITPL